MMKKIISVCLAALIICGSFLIAPYLTDTGASAAIDLSCGEDATWYLDTQTGVMTVSGTGFTYGYDSVNTPAFASFGSRVRSLIFEEGITGIESGFFRSFTSNLTSVSFPSTLEYIGNNSMWSTVSEINIPQSNSLKFFGASFSVNNTKWYKNQPEGVVYLGNCAVGYNGTINSGETVTLRDGTLSVAPNAFYGQSGLTDVVFPDTLEFIAGRAFDNTPFYFSLAPGAHYFGKTLFAYIGNVYLEDTDFTVREGTVSISPQAFWNKGYYMNSIIIPGSVEFIGYEAFLSHSALTQVSFAGNSSLKYIDRNAFFDCANLNDIELPEGTEYIGDSVFGPYRPAVIKIPAGVKRIGKLYGNDTGVRNGRFEVSADNEYYCSDEYGILYNKDKTVLVRASSGNGNIDFTVPETVTQISQGAFRGIRYSYSAVHLPEGLQSIGADAFAYMAYDSGNLSIDFGFSEPEIAAGVFAGNRYLSSVTVRSMDLVFPDGAFSSVNDGFTVYLKKDSAMQEYCENNGLNYEFIDYDLILGEIRNSLSVADGIDSSLYTPESLAALDEAVSAVDLDLKNLTQEQIDGWNAAIVGALAALEYLPADYSAVSEALERAGAVNRTMYTADSLLALDSLVLSVDYKADITQQQAVNALAGEINAAVDALVYREADYSQVNAAVKRAVGVKRENYTEQSLANLDAALMNVEYGLDISFQSKVNAFASGITVAINALIAKPADYSDVNSAIRRADAVNREYYTPESLAELDALIASVDFSLTAENGGAVSEYAAAINAAIDGLTYLPADYTAVDNAISEARKTDRVLWSPASLAALDQSINSVDRSLNITQQAAVDAYAAAITAKLNSLEYAAVTLRNETHGVIIGATAKEIYPSTALTVEKLDPSDITAANFAVGGKVKTALYYDISLILNSVKIQPDGTVTVKIRIPAGVSPEKCKVYHVTDDPVDPLVKFTSAVDGEYIVFETDHFSEFAVLEVETVPEGIVISRAPDKTVYKTGEEFDRRGMVITAFYSNGTKAEVRDYDISVDTSTPGTKAFIVYYTFNGVTGSVSSVITVEGDPAPDKPDTPAPDKPDNTAALPDISIRNYKETLPADYKSKLVFHITSTSEIPDEYKIIWSTGDEGTTCIIDRATEREYKISAKLVKISDNSTAAGTKEETVTVNTGFFAKIIAFFRELFRSLPVYEDNVKK